VLAGYNDLATVMPEIAAQWDQKRNHKLRPDQVTTYSQKLNFEKAVLGIYLSGHPLDDYIDTFASYTHTTEDFASQEEDFAIDGESDDGEQHCTYNVENNEKVTIGGIITELNKRTTRNGNQNMFAGVLEDLYGTVEFVIFPKQYEQFRDLINVDDIVKISGRVSLRNDNPPTIAVEKIEVVENPKEQKIAPKQTAEMQTEKKQKLYLKLNVEDAELRKKLDQIMSMHQGKIEVCLVNATDKKPYMYNYKIDFTNNLKNELIALLGEANVILK